MDHQLTPTRPPALQGALLRCFEPPFLNSAKNPGKRKKGIDFWVMVMYNNFRCHSSDGVVHGGVAQLGARHMRKTTPTKNRIKLFPIWGRSSAGRALEWHSRGHGFDPHRLHHFPGKF